MTRVSLDRMLDRLCLASEKAREGATRRVEWPAALDPDQWCFSPELLSLYGTPVYEALSERERRCLSFYEAVNFFSLNIHGERALIEGLARQLYRRGSQEVSRYLHHFLDEENVHMQYFGAFCLTYAWKIYPDRKLPLALDQDPAEAAFLFFARVLVFEEVVDAYNVAMSKDARLAPVAREINRFHHLDETRHLAFGRRLVRDLFARHAPGWPEETRQRLRRYVSDYFSAVWSEYYNADVYRDAGLPDPYALRASAIAGPQAVRHRRAVSARCVRYLLDADILTEEPTL